MVRPGLINLDFADVETVMTSMGKAMMGTGEADGENRALAATELALNNPLIDDYSLKGAKGLLVNITGGEDIKLFEVDQAVNKIRAEVDPEAELIFGAIKDENLNGKMRVSIVATALDGESPHGKTVLNNVHRIHTRSSGYSDDIQSNLSMPSIPEAGSIQGATALKLEEEISTNPKEDLISGISLENASFVENNLNQDQIQDSAKDEPLDETVIEDISLYEDKSQDSSQTIENEASPQLFSDEVTNETSSESNDQEVIKSDEEDFEIPAFLRKQKF